MGFDNFSMTAFVKSLEMQRGWLSIGIQLCACKDFKTCSAFKISFSNVGEGYFHCHGEVVMVHLKASGSCVRWLLPNSLFSVLSKRFLQMVLSQL